MSENTISNTRLLGIIVVVSIIAMSYILNGGNKIDSNRVGVINKPADTVMNTSNIVNEIMPVKRTSMIFSVNPGALVLSI